MCKHHMNMWLGSEALDKFTAPYKVAVQVQDAECGGGDVGNIIGHGHTVLVKVTLPDGTELIDGQIWDNPDAIEMLQRVHGRGFKFYDHGQELELVLSLGHSVRRYRRPKPNKKRTKKAA